MHEFYHHYNMLLVLQTRKIVCSKCVYKYDIYASMIIPLFLLINPLKGEFKLLHSTTHAESKCILCYVSMWCVGTSGIICKCVNISICMHVYCFYNMTTCMNLQCNILFLLKIQKIIYNAISLFIW